MKFPHTIQVVWNDETQSPEMLPADVLVTDKESVFYRQHKPLKLQDEKTFLAPLSSETSRFKRFILWLLEEEDELGNNNLHYLGSENIPTIEDAVKQFSKTKGEKK